MDKTLEDVLRGLPPKRRPSRLAPYADLIDELRTRRWSYREIARVLAEKCGVQVSYRNVHHFVQTRGFGPKASETHSNAPASLKAHVTHGRLNGPLEASQRIAALKQRAATPESHDLDFEFDPAEPLRLALRGKSPSDR